MSGGPSVCVVGSLMFDLVMRVPRRPAPGETLLASACGTFLGGKGFNQAVAARRMGARVALVGRIGADGFGTGFHAAFEREGIDASGVVVDPEGGTGIAVPILEPDGRNTIIVAPRANMELTAVDVERAARRIESADVVLLQLEVAAEATAAAAALARRAGRTVILNPAPATPVPDALMRLVDVLTPNEVEAATLVGHAVETDEDAGRAARSLRSRGPETVIVTLGDRGAVALDTAGPRSITAHRVRAVDTTAAGDAFNGALGVALAERRPLVEALRLANAAGARAVMRLGAEPSLPRRAEVEALIAGDIRQPRG